MLDLATSLDPASLAMRHAVIYDDLADEYDARASQLRDVTEQSLTRLLSFGPSTGRALDVGTGAGLVAEVLVGAGFVTTAIDVAPRMAAVCSARAPSAEVLVGDYLSHEFAERFDVIVAFAFIHLFPTEIAIECLRKMRSDLRPGGLLLIGTTAEARCREGFEGKADYPGAPLRFRRRWRESAFLRAVSTSGFETIDIERHPDPFGKVWADVIARRPAD